MILLGRLLILCAFVISLGECVINITQFEQEVLKAHNYYRKLHDALPLEIDRNISEIAQKVAESLVNATTLQHSHSRYLNKKLGENIAAWSKYENESGSFCAGLFYSEEKLFNYSIHKHQKGAGHFSQLVWKSSTHVGFGVAENEDTIICVAQYYPPGNFFGKYKENISPPKQEKPAKKDKKKKPSHTKKTTKATTKATGGNGTDITSSTKTTKKKPHYTKKTTKATPKASGDNSTDVKSSTKTTKKKPHYTKKTTKATTAASETSTTTPSPTTTTTTETKKTKKSKWKTSTAPVSETSDSTSNPIETTLESTIPEITLSPDANQYQYQNKV